MFFVMGMLQLVLMTYYVADVEFSYGQVIYYSVLGCYTCTIVICVMMTQIVASFFSRFVHYRLMMVVYGVVSIINAIPPSM